MARILADHNVSDRVVEMLRLAGHHVSTARELHFDRIDDDALLLEAAQRGDILITNNGRDFEMLHNAWIRWSRAWQIGPQHSGILALIQGLPPAPTYEQISTLLNVGLPRTNEFYYAIPDQGWERLPFPS